MRRLAKMAGLFGDKVYLADIMRKIDNLTGVRAFAACWVVLYHLQIDSVRSVPLGSVVQNGWVGVDVFFVLSGLVLSMVYAPRLERFTAGWYKTFLIRRLAKIYPLHLLTFCCSGVVIAIGHMVHYNFHNSDGGNTPWSALWNLLLLHAFGLTRLPSWNIFSWSVSAEWFAYSILFVPMLIGLRRRATVTVAVLVLLAWSGYLALCAYGLHTGPGLTTLGIIRITPEFLAGYLLYRLLPLLTKKGDLLTFAGLLLLPVPCIFPDKLYWLLLPAIMLLLAGASQRGRATTLLFGNRTAILIGEASYSIYLIQLFILLGLNIIMRKVHLNFPGSSAIIELTALGLMIGAGVLCFLFIEEPMRQWVLRFSLKHSATAGAVKLVTPGSDTQTSSTIG